MPDATWQNELTDYIAKINDDGRGRAGYRLSFLAGYLAALNDARAISRDELSHYWGKVLLAEEEMARA